MGIASIQEQITKRKYGIMYIATLLHYYSRFIFHEFPQQFSDFHTSSMNSLTPFSNSESGKHCTRTNPIIIFDILTTFTLSETNQTIHILMPLTPWSNSQDGSYLFLMWIRLQVIQNSQRNWVSRVGWTQKGKKWKNIEVA